MTPNGSDQFEPDEERHHGFRDFDDRDERHHDRHLEERGEDNRGERRSLSGSRSRSPRRLRSRERSRGDEESNPGNSLFVTGLSPRTSDRDLDELFSKYGKVVKAQIMYDPHTRESRGFGFVTMDTYDDAEAAKDNTNGTEVQGKTITVEKARRSRPRTPTPGRYYGPPKRREPRRIDRFDPRYDYSRPHDRYDRPPRSYGREPYYERGGFDRSSSYYDRGGYDRGGYDRGGYDRAYDRGYDRERRLPPPSRYDQYPRPRSPY